MYENIYLQMQRDKEMMIVDYKYGKDGKGAPGKSETYFRIQWGANNASKVWYTWEAESNLPLAKDMIAAWCKDPVVQKDPSWGGAKHF